AAIVQEAVARGIPCSRLDSSSLVTLGHGARQRRILAAETDRTGALAESIAQDRELTRNLLQRIGVPVPEARLVKDGDEAWEAAGEIGEPVVLKPRYVDQGRAVATNLSTCEQVREAYAQVRELSGEVIVERYVPGAEYRLLVVGNRVVSAARRDANVSTE